MGAPQSQAIRVVGCGGHAKVVVDTLVESGCSVTSIYDDNPDRWGGTLLGIPIVGGVEALRRDDTSKVIIAIGNNSAREALAHRLAAMGCEFATAIHPRAIVSRHTKIGAGSTIFAGAVIQAGASVGSHCIVNTGATIDHDCTLQPFAQICPGVHLAGAVELGVASFVGTGAAIGPGVKIGDAVSVGAGAAVLTNVPAGNRAYGVPAKVLPKR